MKTTRIPRNKLYQYKTKRETPKVGQDAMREKHEWKWIFEKQKAVSFKAYSLLPKGVYLKKI